MKKIVWVLAVLLVLAAAASCGQDRSRLVFEKDIEVTSEMLGVTVIREREVALGLEHAKGMAGLVVLGVYTEDAPDSIVLNMSWDEAGPKILWYDEGVVYKFKVEAVLKGEIDRERPAAEASDEFGTQYAPRDTVIPVIKCYGRRTHNDPNEILLDTEFYKPEIGVQTILFLGNSNSMGEYFVGPSPYEYVLVPGEDGVYEIRSNRPDIMETYRDARVGFEGDGAALETLTAR